MHKSRFPPASPVAGFPPFRPLPLSIFKDNKISNNSREILRRNHLFLLEIGTIFENSY